MNMNESPALNQKEEPQATREMVGAKATDFVLGDNEGNRVQLFEVLENSPVLLAFYPWDFSMVCTKQLCNYRDNFQSFADLGIQLYGVSGNSAVKHQEFSQKYEFPFRLLADPDNKVAKAYGCRSLFMLGKVSRAVIIINRQRIVLYRYVEPTVLTRRSAEELVGILKDLRQHSLL